MNAASIAVTVVAGFLGAGKTTLLNRMAQQPQYGRMAVIVNDFGELNIDAAIIAEVTDAVVSLQNGCICCTVQEDLLAQLVSLTQMRPRLDRIVIECSGVSDPQRIVQTLGYPQLKAQLHLDTVITLVDASGYRALEGEFARLSRAQVACADLVLLNKADLISAAELETLRAEIGGRARVLSTVQAMVPDALLLGERSERNGLSPVLPRHDQLFESWVWQGNQPLPAKALRDWLGQLPKDLFRLKGLVHLQGNDQPFWLQHVGSRSQFTLANGQTPELAVQLVFIARRGSGLREGLEAQLSALQGL
ncbi:GTP-binding protein [Pseudomonas sp. TH32]|uniref:CobW family GTP-binding protein n=1 Tax=Pseudomonas sp. TH32 TaxID=2796397 RepID=UPI001914D7DF|nr:GTP-binding protein [Pseudomonas sp. TH32]MBK5439613.1 GTP-binding protein [Pseudomonas sp. TH32]